MFKRLKLLGIAAAATVLMAAIVYIVVNIIIDAAYTLLDPRVRYG